MSHPPDITPEQRRQLQEASEQIRKLQSLGIDFNRYYERTRPFG
jgi:hypothetical protein